MKGVFHPHATLTSAPTKDRAEAPVDKSWGGDAPGILRVRTNERPAERAARRAQDREARATERAAAISQRLAVRAAGREADAIARGHARTERREHELRAISDDPHAAAAKRHRGSGRRDVVREQRDTRGYATVLDEGRIRELAARGASVAGLADAFDLAEPDIARILAG